MRVFFAIEFEDEIKNFLYQIQNGVRQHCVSGNFTHKENFHLTLRFIGEQSTKEVERLMISLKDTAFLIPKFELGFDTLGKFERGSKKILWLGLKNSNYLNNLYEKLECTLEGCGYAREERTYNPHITLGREVRTENFGNMLKNITISNTVFKVNSISLMESTRINNKLCYVPVAREKLLDSKS